MRRICSSSMPTVMNSDSAVRLVVEHAERPVAGPDQLGRRLGDAPQDHGEAELGGDDHDRVEQPAQLFDPGVLVGRHAPMIDGRPSNVIGRDEEKAPEMES